VLAGVFKFKEFEKIQENSIGSFPIDNILGLVKGINLGMINVLLYCLFTRKEA